MRRFITVHERKGKLLVCASSEAPNGTWVQAGDCTVLKSDAPREDIGEAVRQSLAVSGTVEPSMGEPVLEAAGVSSWATFSRGSKRVTIAADGEEITVTPTDRNGSSYRPANAEAIRIPSSSDAELLGETVLRALANSS